nr:efflux RND transporter periplasmic adaptor subunit [Desulforadius tongensis]
MAGCGREEVKQVQEKTVPVEVFTAVKTDFSQEVEVTGEILAGTEVSIIPKVSGRVAAVYVKLGQQVGRGTVLLEIEGAGVKSALAAAEANLESAEKNYQRVKQLYAEGAVSQADFERAETNLKVNRAQYDQAKDSYDELTVVSPINGKVAYLNVDEGEMVGQQGPVAGVVNLDTVKVKLNISENLIGRIKEGQKVKVRINALNKTVEGKVRAVSPQIDKTTRAFPVEVEIANPRGEILAGMVARIKLPTARVKDAVVIPARAVLEHNGQQKIFVVEDGAAKERLVKVGLTGLDRVQIVEGLKENEKVIVTGNRLVGDGQKVKIIKTVGAAGGENSENS